MSQTPELQLRKATSTTSKMTFDAPNILVAAKDDTKSIREGGPRQVDLRTEVSWSEKAVDEHDQVFAIKAKNQIKFGGATLSVINDATEFGETRLSPTSPTATEYLKKKNEVLIHFDCRPDLQETKRLGRTVYKVARNFIKLP